MKNVLSRKRPQLQLQLQLQQIQELCLQPPPQSVPHVLREQLNLPLGMI